jgi:hypothetical protein
MTAHDPDRELDALLGEGGGKIGDLYRRLPRYEPPRRLDRAVLGEAARAVHSGKPPRRQRWIVGVGSAAGLVLAAGIAWRIGHDAMSPGEMPATESRRVVPVEPIDEAAHAKREELAQPKSEADAASAPASNAAGAVNPRQDTAPQKEVVRKSRASAKPSTPPAMAEPPTPAPAPAAAPPPQAFPGAAEQRERAQDDFEKSGKDKLGVSETGAAAADKRAPAAARGAASPTVPSSSIELQRDMQLAPHDWLAHIRQLMQQGRTQQATESLRLFVRAHPDARVPDDLRPLLD